MFFRKKKNQVTCMIIDHDKIIESSLTRKGEFLDDAMAGKTYAIVEPPVWFKVGKRDERRFIVDEQKGCTVRIDRDIQDFLKVKTNPDLLATVIGSRLVKDAFDIRPKMMTLVLCLIAGMIIGFFIGLMM